MRTPRRSYLTQHRRQRLVLWALAMLAWIASVVAGMKPRRRHLDQRGDISLDWLAGLAKRLILIRAADMIAARPRRPDFFKHGRDLHRRHFMRSAFGSALRRALKHRDPVQRIVILISAVTHLDAWAARFTKRLHRGFSRLWAIAPAPTPAALILGPPAPPPARADSS